MICQAATEADIDPAGSSSPAPSASWVPVRQNRLIARGATHPSHDPVAMPAIALGKVATRKVLIDADCTA